MKVIFRSRFLSGALLAFLSLLGTFILLEIVIRTYVPKNDVNSFIADSKLGFRRNPDSEGFYKTNEFNNYIKFNAYGWNDVERSIAKPDNTFRIIVLGDSYVEGLQVAREQTFTHKLETLLNNSGRKKRYEVINMGVGGYGTTQELLLLKDRGLEFEPDLVILSLLTGNDIRNNSIFLDQSTKNWKKAFRPYIELSKDTSILHLPGSKGLSKISRAGWKYWLFDNFMLIKFIHKRLSRIEGCAKLMVKYGFLAKSTYLNMTGIPVDYQIYLSNTEDEWEKAWTTTEYLLNEMKKILNERNIPFVVMIVTNREQIYREDWMQILKSYPEMQEKKWDLSIPDKRVASILNKLGIDYISLKPFFQQKAKAKAHKRLHYKNDGHWTAEGHALGAKLLFNHIKSIPQLQ
jgi:hypothetical protein